MQLPQAHSVHGHGLAQRQHSQSRLLVRRLGAGWLGSTEQVPEIQA